MRQKSKIRYNVECIVENFHIGRILGRQPSRCIVAALHATERGTREYKGAKAKDRI